MTESAGPEWAFVGVLRSLLDGWWSMPGSTSDRSRDPGRPNTE
jgi:hypothetical protein